jgi:amino acid transporter
MSVLRAGIVLLIVVACAAAAMLIVRRRAPEGGYYADGDRASGVFGLLATGFSVMIGFVVFLAFSTYDSSRSGAEDEALLVVQQLETAQYFADENAQELTAALVCYARDVAGAEWEQLKQDTLGDQINIWGPTLFRAFQKVEPASSSEEAAYSLWLDQSTARQAARNDRVHLSAGVIPTPLWMVLFLISLVIFVFMLGFADRSERATSQVVLMGSVMTVVVSMLLLLQFLNDPYRPGPGALAPTAMERALVLIDQELSVIGGDDALPCDESGRPKG